MWKRWFSAVTLGVVFAAVAVASGSSEERNLPDPNKACVDEPPTLPSVYGKYRVLLRKLYVPQDEANYGRFSDFGPWQGTAYLQWNDLPQGHWVYSYPYWYIWRDCVKPNATLPPGALPPGAGKLGALQQPGIELPLTK